LYEDLDVQPQKEGNSLQLQESLTWAEEFFQPHELSHSEGKKWVENAVKFQKLMAFKKEISHGIRG
jgi:hypothetical protein